MIPRDAPTCLLNTSHFRWYPRPVTELSDQPPQEDLSRATADPHRRLLARDGGGQPRARPAGPRRRPAGAGHARQPRQRPVHRPRDPKGNPVRLARATGHVSNYTEEKVPPYTLPDPAGHGGRRARHDRRRVVQGAAARRSSSSTGTRSTAACPTSAPEVTWEVAETDPTARDGTAVMKRVVGRMGDKPDGPRMNLTVYLPAKASGPVPVLLSITFGFGPAARPRERPPSRRRAKPRRRPAGSTPWARCSAAAGGTPR